MPVIVLKPGREKSLLNRHPWIFSGAVDELRGLTQPGETVEVRSHRGEFLAWAACNPASQIIGRIWSWSEVEQVNRDFLKKLVARSIKSRQTLCSGFAKYPALRLVYAESDGLPGFIVDRYSETLVVQFLSAGVEYWRESLLDVLEELMGNNQIYERSDVDVRKLEGLPEKAGLLRGSEPDDKILIEENGVSFYVDIRHGHKTGFYLDQKSSRLKIRELAKDKDVLDCFCYTGGFGINALIGGARSVLGIDSSEDALLRAKENLSLNRFDGMGEVSWLGGDVFRVLRELRDRNASFDLIILDPPKFAPTTSQVERAARGYKDINLLGLKLLRPGGILVTFSCSGGVSADLFQKIVASAALDAGVHAQIIGHLEQSSDHPVALNFPEGAYLKGLVIRVA